jgi:hypothetical protein
MSKLGVFAGVVALAVLTGAAVAAPQNPELTAHVGENDDASVKSAALSIGELNVDVTVTGDMARTTVTAHFLNASPQVLEGNFVFDMPAGSVVTGYGLDINGKMTDGVLASQRLATLTYEKRVRRGYDPGLAEVTRSGAFMTRVFPIVANRGRTVKLTFVTPLDPGQPLTIPLATDKPVGSVTIHVHGAKGAVKGSDALALKDGETRATNIALPGALIIGPVAPPATVQLAQHASGDTFFEIADTAQGRDAAPGHLRIYWDSSLSRRGADLAKEIDLAGRYVDAVHPAALDVVFFSTGKPMVRSFKAPRGAEIAGLLKATDYQGGTSFQPLFADGLPPADACLLFSDGNVTVDAYRAMRLPCEMSAVSSVKDANRALLGALARKSGGAYIDLSTTSEDDGLAALAHRGPRVRTVRDDKGNELDFAMLPARGDRFRIVGRAPGEGAVVVDFYGDAARRYDLHPAAAVRDDALGALWASQVLGEMGATDAPDRGAMIQLSQRYSVASTVTSFVVFENLEDYVAADVAPPASLGKDDYARYLDLKKQAAAATAAAQRDRLDHVVQLWNDEKEWWVTSFTPRKRAEKTQPGEAGDSSVETAVTTGHPAPMRDSAPHNAPLPPPPPPPPPAPRPGQGSSSETVVVTGQRAVEDIQSVPVAVTAETAPDTKAAEPAGPAIDIQIAPWDPKRPYIQALDDAKPEQYWAVYRAQEKDFGTLPAFYLDSAEFMARHGRKDDAIRIALNALELPTADSATMTILADRLMRYGDEARALWLYEHILAMEPDRPQPRRNLALALVTAAEHTPDKALQRKDYVRAIGLLNEIVTTPWDGVFEGIEVVSLMEANHIVPKLKALGVREVPLDKRLIALLDVDMRITLEWNTDETDMDLWVDEPGGERVIYSHRNSAAGGRLSNDMRYGFGPEEYLIHHAPDGAYTVRVNVYATDRINPNGATTVRVHIYRNYGRPNEQMQTLELELTKADDAAHVVGAVTVKGGGR